MMLFKIAVRETALKTKTQLSKYIWFEAQGLKETPGVKQVDNIIEKWGARNVKGTQDSEAVTLRIPFFNTVELLWKQKMDFIFLKLAMSRLSKMAPVQVAMVNVYLILPLGKV